MSLLELGPVDPALRPAFEAMTFPAYRHLLDLTPAEVLREGADPRRVQPVAIGARVDGEPAGLLLAGTDLDAPGQGRLLSLFVRRDLRRRGLARRLLQALQQAMAAAGIEALEAVWMRERGGEDPVGALLGAQGWSPPQRRMLTLRCHAEDFAKVAWIQKFRPRGGYEIFSWMDLKPTERQALIDSDARDGWIAPDLRPWIHDARGFDPVTSMGLRLHGEIVGWVINHRLDPGTVRFTCSFVRRDLARMGRILPLYCEAFERIRRFGLQRAIFTTPVHHGPMLAFAERYFGPWARYVGETQGSRVELGGS